MTTAYTFDGLLPANVCLVSLLSSEQRSQFERFRLHHAQMINKTSIFEINRWAIMGRRVELTLKHLMFNCPTFFTADFPLQITARPITFKGILQSMRDSQHLLTYV